MPLRPVLSGRSDEGEGLARETDEWDTKWYEGLKAVCMGGELP